MDRQELNKLLEAERKIIEDLPGFEKEIDEIPEEVLAKDRESYETRLMFFMLRHYDHLKGPVTWMVLRNILDFIEKANCKPERKIEMLSLFLSEEFADIMNRAITV